MELKKINEKLEELVRKATANKERTNEKLKDAKDNLKLVEKELDESMMIGNDEKTEKLVLEKRTLEEKINFYNDFIQKSASTPLITKVEADSLFKDVVISVTSELDKNYDKIIDEYKQTYNDAEKLLNECIKANELSSKINNASKSDCYTFDNNKVNVLKDIVNINYPLKTRRNI